MLFLVPFVKIYYKNKVNNKLYVYKRFQGDCCALTKKVLNI